jgi:hypothetical protein
MSLSVTTQTHWSRQYIYCWPDDISPPTTAPSLTPRITKEVAAQTQWSMLHVPWPISPTTPLKHPRTQGTQTPWSQAHIQPWNSTPTTSPNPAAMTQTNPDPLAPIGHTSPPCQAVPRPLPPWARIPQWLGGPPMTDALAERMNKRARGLLQREVSRPRRGGLELYPEAQSTRNQAAKPPNP